jgi:hypothetical protein
MERERFTQLFNIFLPMNRMADDRYCRLAVSVAAPVEASGLTLETAWLGDFTLLRAFLLRSFSSPSVNSLNAFDLDVRSPVLVLGERNNP